MDFDWDVAGAVSDIAGGLFQTGYNIYTNKRDFDYQKALQKQIFEREDTAVQRKMADLQAAGINPNLAAGSSANAGSVVSRSSTNDINVGSILDTLAAKNQIALQRQEKQNAEVQNEILQAERDSKNMNDALDTYYTAMQFGFNPRVEPKFENGKLYWNFNFVNTKPNKMIDTPMFNAFRNQIDYAINQNSYLEKQLNWYNAQQVADMLTGGIGAITGSVNAGANFKRASNMIRR